MKRLIQGWIAAVFLMAIPAHAAEPLRVYIRSGPKTHGPGAHDHPAFLRDWTKLLNERGAKATGGDVFPTAAQLSETDVLVLHAEEAGNIEGEDRKNLEAYLNRGGGVVAVHGGSVSRDADWYKTVIGGSWRFGKTKWLEGHQSFYFTDRENPITKDCSNFDLDDEIYYDMELLPEVKVLAAAFTPKPKDASHAGDGERVNIYDIQPQMWTYETGNRRAFTFVPGHLYENFSHTSVRTLLLRGIAWAGKRDNADELCKPDELGDALRYPEGGPTRPEKAAEKIELHPEFGISLVAAEPLVNKVLNLDWDEKGRMWVVESPEYPNGLRRANTDEWKESGSFSPGEYEREPLDRISILTDTDGDGRMDKKQVFADKLELATGFVFHKNGVIVSAAPDIWFLEDTDGDEVCDKRTKLYTGLGTFDTHAVMNNLRWGLDGWVYATHGYSAGDVTCLGVEGKPPVRISSGVVRFRPDGSEIEMFSSKNGNTWGLTMTSDGQCFWTQPTSGVLLFHTLLPEWVLAKGRMPGANGWKGMLAGAKIYPLMKWEQLAYVQIDLVGSYTAAAGCAIYEGGAWPERWNRSYFTGEPTVNLVSHYFLKPDGPSYSASKEAGREETEFIRSRDLWFRPVETRVGPDGALYVIDFYNQAVIHNDTRGPKHGPANAAVRPDRDHYFGRIWKVQHKQAKKIEVPVINRANAGELIKASSSENAHTRMTAIRLMREGGLLKEVPADGSEPYRLFLESRAAATPEAREKVIAEFLKAGDEWTKSALVAAASEHAPEFVEAILVSKEAARLGEFASALLPSALADGGKAADLVRRCADAPSAADEVKILVISEIAKRDGIRPELSDGLSAALLKLMEDPRTLPATLPLVAKWDSKGGMGAVMKPRLEQLRKTAGDRKAAQSDRLAAAKTLASIADENGLASLQGLLSGTDEPEDFQRALLGVIGESGRTEVLAKAYGGLRPSLGAAAFDQIVTRVPAALALLGELEAGRIEVAKISPGNIARLKTHPDKSVSDKAMSLKDLLTPGAKERAETLAKLLPEVTKQGNVENGKLLFAGACAVCHHFGDAGKEVGPPLTGMGSHGAAELLIHIVDPNREVDPSFWQWNITKKNGEALAGVIASENAATVILRSQAGDVEVPKAEIASRQNTRRSLMPEGLEGLGAEGLRDILAYMTAGDSRYRVVDLRDAYTADSRRGLFANPDQKGDSVFPVSFGDVKALGVPFFLMEPAKSSNGRNLVVLKGGGRDAVASGYPQTVGIPVHLEATRFYLLSGIAGWGYPATRDFRPAMEVTLHFADGRKEQTVLLNGVAFSDYLREEEVSGSKLVPGFVKRGQMRLIRLDVKKPGVVTKIELKSFDNGVTPVVAGITADLSDEAPAVETAEELKTMDLSDPKTTTPSGQRFAEPKKGLRVLLAGAGSSHDFPRFFLTEDAEILKQAGGIDVVATPNGAEAIALLPQADVVVFSGNDPQYALPGFMKALNAFADSGKGVIALHAATWYNYPPETGYNKRFVGGGTRSHGKGDFEVAVVDKEHPVTAGLSPRFTIWDESYRMEIADPENFVVLAENHAEGKTHPSVWVKKDPKARIVGITLGHDQRAHGNPEFRKLLVNAVKWVGGGK